MEKIIDATIIDAKSSSESLKSLTEAEKNLYAEKASALVFALTNAANLTTYPEDLQLATVYIAEFLFQNKDVNETISSENLGDYSYNKIQKSLPTQAQIILDKYASARLGSFGVAVKPAFNPHKNGSNF